MTSLLMNQEEVSPALWNWARGDFAFFCLRKMTSTAYMMSVPFCASLRSSRVPVASTLNLPKTVLIPFWTWATISTVACMLRDEAPEVSVLMLALAGNTLGCGWVLAQLSAPFKSPLRSLTNVFSNGLGCP